jgi:nitrous oxidase accessory protein
MDHPLEPGGLTSMNLNVSLMIRLLGLFLISLLLTTIYLDVIEKNPPRVIPLTPNSSNATQPVRVNSTPVLEPIGNFTVEAGKPVVFSVMASDPGGNEIKYYHSQVPSGATFDEKTRIFRWTPSDLQAGLYGIVFTVFNGFALDHELVLVRVTNFSSSRFEDAPTLSSIFGALNLKENSELRTSPAPGREPDWIVQPGESIGRTIEKADQGDTILVRPGVYRERLVIDKQITLEGQGNPVIDAGGAGTGIFIAVDGVEIRGFTIANSGGSLYESGIRISSSRNVIANNTCRDDQYGIYLLPQSHGNIITSNYLYNNTGAGLFGENAFYETISSNVIVSNDVGVQLDLSGANNITGNIIRYNREGGIVSNSFLKNTIRNNWIKNNGVTGLTLSSGGNNLITGNIIQENTGNGLRVNQSFDPGLLGNQMTIWSDSEYVNFIYDNQIIRNYGMGIQLFDTSTIIRGNAIRFNANGIFLVRSRSLIFENDISGNSRGIFILWSGNSTIRGNSLDLNNDGIGIEGPSGDNEIYENTLDQDLNTGMILSPDTRNNQILENRIINGTADCILDRGTNYLKDNFCAPTIGT